MLPAKWWISPIMRAKKEARFQMLEKLADYDEQLMEELLGDIEPDRDEGSACGASWRKAWWCRC